MSVCSNCKARLSCGCQRRVAKDGKQVCSGCVNGYNNKLGNNTQPPVPTNHTATPVINSITLKK